MLFEAVPNFSEGRDEEKVGRIVESVKEVPNIRVLDLHSDPDHNRSVLTFAGGEDAILEASSSLAKACAEEIDLSTQTGVHPRMGSLDVLPFVPLKDATMDDASRLARRAGKKIASLGFAVYLYEHAATAPHRRNLSEVRRGGFEGVSARVGDPLWKPDFGPSVFDPRLGAVAVGAREFLVAFNAFLDTDDVEVAKSVAAKVRGRDGGLPGLKALGLEVGEQAQVSMNLTDIEKTSLPEALEAVRAEAGKFGAGVEWTELVGLMPLEAAVATSRYYLGLRDFDRSRVLEAGLWE